MLCWWAREGRHTQMKGGSISIVHVRILRTKTGSVFILEATPCVQWCESTWAISLPYRRKTMHRESGRYFIWTIVPQRLQDVYKFSSLEFKIASWVGVSSSRRKKEGERRKGGKGEEGGNKEKEEELWNKSNHTVCSLMWHLQEAIWRAVYDLCERIVWARIQI